MKRVMVLVVAAFFLFSGVVFAQGVTGRKGEEVTGRKGEEVKAKEPKAKAAAKETAPKVEKKKASGTVTTISDTALKLQGKDASSDFILPKAYPDIKAGDKVTVTYVVKEGKNVAEKISKAKEPAPKKAAGPGQEVKGRKGEEVKGKKGEEVKGK